jgi:DNA ligase (NAD+)
MVDILGVDNLIDILTLTKESLLKLPKFGEKKASNTLNEIHKVNDEGVYEWQILAAMNIPGIGRTLSKTLCKEFGLNSLMELCLRSNAKGELIAIEGIEEKRAGDIVNGVLKNMSYLTGLRDMMYLKFDRVEEELDLPTVCFSGSFSEQKSVYYEKLKGKYEIAKSVTKKLNILVVADPSKGSSKQKKAEKMGIKIMSLEEIMGG